ncbi:MAG: hypothetical protein V3T16_06090 [Gemmatimonadales bacterium]
MKITRILSPLTLIASAMLAGCGGSTQLTNVWADPQGVSDPIEKMLIIGVTDEQAVRRSFEDQFVSELERERISAVSSAAALGPGKIDSTIIHDYVRQNDIDAILVTRLLGVDKQQQYNPGTTYWEPSYYGGFYGYYNWGYSAYTTPGYWTEYEVLRLETLIYRSNAQLLWAANSETFDPGSESTVVKALADAVIQDLDRRDLLAF